MQLIRKKYAEEWQENETSIIIKMLNQSIKNKEHDKVAELKRSLLELERKSEKATSDEDPSFSPPQDLDLVRYKSKSFSGIALRQSGSERSETSQVTHFSASEATYLERAVQQNTKQHDALINVMILGSSSSGKTSLMHALLGQKCPSQVKPTNGYFNKYSYVVDWTRDA